MSVIKELYAGIINKCHSANLLRQRENFLQQLLGTFLYHCTLLWQQQQQQQQQREEEEADREEKLQARVNKSYYNIGLACSCLPTIVAS